MSGAAKRPSVRTVDVAGDPAGEFAEWTCTARADFRAGFLADLQSGKVERVIAVLDAIVIAHNWPTEKDELAEHMADVDPYRGLLHMGGRIFEAIAKLPPR